MTKIDPSKLSNSNTQKLGKTPNPKTSVKTPTPYLLHPIPYTIHPTLTASLPPHNGIPSLYTPQLH